MALSASSCQPAKEPVASKPAARTLAWYEMRSTVPDPFLETTRFLAEHGQVLFPLTDYCHAAAIVDVDLGGRPVKRVISGWMDPNDRSKPRLLLCVDGQNYAATESGSRADPSKDLQLLTSKMDRWNNLHTEAAAGLLMVAKKPDLAERILHEIGPSGKSKAQEFMGRATDFLSRWADRTIGIYLLGDYALAFRNSVQIQKHRGEFERQARSVLGDSWVQQMSQPSMGGNGVFRAFPFLESIDSLVNECARRMTRQDIAPAQPPSPPSMTDMIKQQIDQLENLQVGFSSRSGTVDWMQSRPFVALVQRDRAALMPLLECLESDTRLTRTVVPSSGVRSVRRIVPVSEAARAAIGAILKWPNISNLNGQPASPQQIRAYIVKYGTGKAEDQWFNVLADDQATPENWLDSVRHLFEAQAGSQPSDGQFHPTNLRAEEVRSRTNPSLGDLLKKRIEDLVSNATTEPSGAETVGMAMRIASCLAKWDPGMALPELSKTSMVAMSLQPGLAGPLEKLLPMTVSTRERLGDRSALYEYCQWLANASIPLNRPLSTLPFQPIFTSSDSNEADSYVAKLFSTNSSSWSLSKLADSPARCMQLASLIHSPLIQYPSFRSALSNLLKDRQPIGSISVDDKSTYTIVFSATSRLFSVKSSHLKSDLQVPKPGDRIEYRKCDAFAVGVSELKGAPAFEPYWPEAARDTAIHQQIEFLKSNLGASRSSLVK